MARTWVGILWKRRPGPWKTAPDTGWALVPLDQPDAFTVSPARDAAGSVVVVELRYEIHHTVWHYLPILGQTPRHLLYAFDCRPSLPIPARPYADRLTFPVVLQPGKPARFYPAVRSLVGGRWVLTAVRVRLMTAAAAGHYLKTLCQ